MEDMHLKNGIMVQVADKSVLLGGDLYLIRLDISYSLALGPEDEDLQAYSGARILKTRRLERPAVQLRVLEETKNAMLKSFLDTNEPYMKRPSFVTKFKAKMLKDYREEEEKVRRRNER